MKLAIIGTGISGLTTAWLLHKQYDVHIFEANSWIGGHTNTRIVQHEGKSYPVDTGFIVFNHRTYPYFTKILEQLEVETLPTKMSFSVWDQKYNFEYSSDSLNSLFSQRKNFFNIKHYQMIWEIVKFNLATRKIEDFTQEPTTLGEYLQTHGYSVKFIHHYIIPMSAAIWSSNEKNMLEMPLQFFIQFMKNHGLLSINDQPQWRVIAGGAKRYVEKMTQDFHSAIQLNTPIEWIERHPQHVLLQAKGGTPQKFDHVIMATHSDQALQLLKDASIQEREILGAMPYQDNLAVLHTDISVLPKNRRSWASWNYEIPQNEEKPVAVSYNMNILQHLQGPHLLVTLNRRDQIDPQQILQVIPYAHPIFTLGGVQAQSRHHEISGVNRTHYCGAYWRYGFHEDGVWSALRVGEEFGITLEERKEAWKPAYTKAG